MRPLKTICAIFLLLTGHQMYAAAPEQQSYVTNQLTLNECVRMALEHNLGIQIERVNPIISEYQLEGSYSIYEPTFELGYRHRKFERTSPTISGGIPTFAVDQSLDDYDVSFLNGLLPTGTRYSLGGGHRKTSNNNGSGPGRNEYDTDLSAFNLTQPLLRDFWIDSGRAQIKIYKHNIRQSAFDLQFQTMRVVRDVQLAYYELVAALEEVRVRDKALQLATQLFEENQKKVLAGTLAPLEEKNAESQAAVALGDLIAARRNVVFRENMLKNLVTDNYEKWHSVRINPTEKLLVLAESYDRPDSWVNALTKRPDFNAAKVDLEKQGVLVKLRFNQIFPALDIVGGYGVGGTSFDSFSDSTDRLRDRDNNDWSIGARLSIPLGNRAARTNHKVAKETMKQLELQLFQLKENILVDVDNSITLAESSYQQIPARRSAREFAQQALDAEQKKLDNGRSTSFFVLQFQRDLTSAQSEEIRALTTYNKAVAEFYFSEGTTLERNNVLIQIP